MNINLTLRRLPVIAAVASFVLVAGCKSSSTMPVPSMPTSIPSSSPPGIPKPTSGSGSESGKSSSSSSSSSQGQGQGQSAGSAGSQGSDGSQGKAADASAGSNNKQKGAEDGGDKAAGQDDKSGKSAEARQRDAADEELAEMGQAVADAADAVARAAEALARAKARQVNQAQSGQTAGEAEKDDDTASGEASESGEENEEQSADQSGSNEPNYDPFAVPQSGGAAASTTSSQSSSTSAARSAKAAASKVAQAASAVSKASQSVKRAAQKSQITSREKSATSEDVAEVAESLESGSASLEEASAKLNDKASAFDGGPQMSDEIVGATAHEAAHKDLYEAARKLIEAREALLKAAVDSGMFPDEMVSDERMEIQFEDIRDMVAFLEDSVNLLSVVLEAGGLPNFDFPELPEAAPVLAGARKRADERARQQDGEGGAEAAAGAAVNDRVAVLDVNLDRTLVGFDGELAKARQRRKEGNGQGTMGDEGGDGMGAMTGGDGSGAQGGGQGNADGPGAGDGSGQDGQGSGQGSSASRPAATAAQGGNGSGMAGGGAGGRDIITDVPIPDGQDDDVVARQLREAAMAESDPELRARLWEEYRKYKNATAN